MPANLLWHRIFTNYYYWYNKNKIPITYDPSASYLKLVNKEGKQAFQKSQIASLPGISDTALYAYSDSEFVAIAPTRADSRLLQSKNIDVAYKGSLYRNETAGGGGTMLILPRITVELKDGASIKEFTGRHSDMLSLREDRGFNTYVFDCKLKNSEEVLNLSNSISEKDAAVNWSEPDFYTNVRANTTDPMWDDQYYLKNTGQFGGTAGIDINVEPVWTFSAGVSATRVAVIDEGVETHEDLFGRVLTGYTAGSTTGTGAPQNGVKGHGEACAGIIAASQNLVGIGGIAPNVSILPINIFPNTPDPFVNPSGGATAAQIAASIDWAWNQGAADVINCSWEMSAQSNDVDAALTRARTQGRVKGAIHYGCPVVFASGNGGGAVSYPASNSGMITVGAVQNTGTIQGYSARGASMDVVAPSGNTNLTGDIRTIDRMGAAGYNATNYMNNFGGTSAAAPQVTGVIALMLSENPLLYEGAVTNKIQIHARDRGTAGFDNTYGYGLLDACGSVTDALGGALAISGNDVICSGTSQYTLRWYNGVAGGVAFGGALTWTSSNPSVLTVSSTGNPVTVTKVGNGEATITATFATGCGNIQSTKVIAAGPPATPTISYTYQGATSYVFTASYTGVAHGFNWWVDGVQRRTNADNITYWDIPCQQSIRIKCNQTNTCGTSSMSQEEWVINYNCYPFMALSISPNPSTGMVTVSLQNNAADKKATTAPAKQELIKEISLYDQSGGLRKKWKMNNTATYQINVSEFPSGVYFIEVNDGTQKQRQQLLIQK